MSAVRVRRRIAAILESNALPCTESDAGFSLRFSSAIVHVGLEMLGDQVLVQLRSDVLRDVSPNATTRVLEELNSLNCSTLFGKWVYHIAQHVVALEYDLLGDHLHENELMTALTMVARLADRHDDLLQAQFGGRKAAVD